VKTFRDFLYSEKNELVSEKRIYEILKKDENYILHMRPAKRYPLRKYDVRSFGNLVQVKLQTILSYNFWYWNSFCLKIKTKLILMCN